MQDVDEVLDNLLESAVHVDLSVLDGLDVLDESVVVGLDGLDLFVAEIQQRSQRLEQSSQGGFQLSQQSVKLGRRLVRWGSETGS